MMNARMKLRAIGALAGLVAVTALSGCDKKSIIPIQVANQLPVVRITSAPISRDQFCQPDPVRSCYSLNIHWDGYDPDGRVDHYVYAVDPPTGGANPETTWTVVDGNEARLLFRATERVPQPNPTDPGISRDFHVFVLKAVDNMGQAGPYTARAFFSYTQAPEVQITSPRPSDILIVTLTPSVRITWNGTDYDGVFNTKPVKYKYILLTPSSPMTLQAAIDEPDSVRRFYAPHFTGWDSVSGDTTTVQLTNLTPEQQYIFVVVAFDEAGAYSPIFSLTTNMLRFKVGFGNTLGSTITAFNEFFNYRWRPNYCPCPSTQFFIEVPSGEPGFDGRYGTSDDEGRLTINWEATPPNGANIKGFRWALDIRNGDVTDETPRPHPDSIRYWSAVSLGTTSVTLGAFPGTEFPLPPEEHLLYIEAQDDVGLKSLGIIRFQVIRPNMQPGQVLIVRDTRLTVDNRPRTQQCVESPRGPWPTTAELDTFLFAKGGVPWTPREDDTPSALFPRGPCPDGYPVGTLSSPGLFAGYDFDTVGTRIQRSDLTTPRLFKLSLYEFVVWMVDPKGATFDNGGTDLISPGTALRFMSGPGRFNTFAAYIKMGGKAWMMGGGGGFATNMPWNRTGNDQPSITFSSLTTPPDLGPGRFMYDIARWQSSFRSPKLPAVFSRFGGRFDQRPHPDPLHYSRFSGELPARLDVRTRQNTPDLPPLRANQGDYYPPSRSTACEYLNVENYIQENVSDNPEIPIIESTLDTLYDADGGGLPQANENPRNVVMTYYKGPGVPQGFVFSGFTPWDFYRPHSQALVDFVFQRMWGLQPDRGARMARSAQHESVARPIFTPRSGASRPGAIRGTRTEVRRAAPIRKPVPATGGLRRPAGGE